jgi:hypothetical protein
MNAMMGMCGAIDVGPCPAELVVTTSIGVITEAIAQINRPEKNPKTIATNIFISWTSFCFVLVQE